MPNIFSPQGRLRRIHYLACLAAINLSVFVLHLAILGAETRYGANDAYDPLYPLVSTVAIWPLYCIMAKRLHDAGYRTGRWALLAIGAVILSSLVQIIASSNSTISTWLSLALLAAGAAMAFWILIAPPKRRRNRHGPDPRQAPSARIIVS